ncbi:MAG TPA: NADH-quinone oxidoreductase subunit A [Nitrososphaerales archaeon]|nr:NADH-quinone oxidoreductase subunit A [Nitrososphaerales archaeon]
MPYPFFGDIGTVFVMGLVGVAFTLPVIIVPKLFAPKKPNPIKNLPFEAGQVPVGVGKMHYMMQYYAYLLMFIVFDVMGMFLYAWASAYLPLALGPDSDFVFTLFIALLLVPMGIALALAGRREIW